MTFTSITLNYLGFLVFCREGLFFGSLACVRIYFNTTTQTTFFFHTYICMIFFKPRPIYMRRLFLLGHFFLFLLVLQSVVVVFVQAIYFSLAMDVLPSQVDFLILIGQFDWLFLFHNVEFGIPDLGFAAIFLPSGLKFKILAFLLIVILCLFVWVCILCKFQSHLYVSANLIGCRYILHKAEFGILNLRWWFFLPP